MKARKPTATSKPRKTTTKKADIDEFIRSRQPALARHTRADLDRMTEEALAKIDQEAAYKDSLAILERYGVKPGPRARPRTQ